MQPGLNKQLQPHEIKSYKHKIKNQAGSAPDTDTQRDNRRCIWKGLLHPVGGDNNWTGPVRTVHVCDARSSINTLIIKAQLVRAVLWMNCVGPEAILKLVALRMAICPPKNV